MQEHQDADIHLQGDTIKRVKTFTYLGSTLVDDGELDAEVTHIVQSGWKNWKRVSGALCDRKMNVGVKRTLFHTYCSPMYTAQLWWNYKKSTITRLQIAYHNIL